MAVDLLKVAEILEKAADVIDEQETSRAATVKEARDGALKVLAERYSSLTGEDLAPEVMNKLAASGDDVLETVQAVLEKTASTGVESLGRASDEQASPRPLNKQEAAQAAWERFGNWAVND